MAAQMMVATDVGVAGFGVLAFALSLGMVWALGQAGEWRRRAGVLESKVEELEKAVIAPPHQEPAALRDPIYEELLTRLIDASFPKREENAREGDEDAPGSPAEYEVPPATLGDWTDPFIGLERSLVGGLRPGEAIPGIGDTMGNVTVGDDATGGLANWDDHPRANGFDADDDAAREGYRDVGEEMFEAWEGGADRG